MLGCCLASVSSTCSMCLHGALQLAQKNRTACRRARVGQGSDLLLCFPAQPGHYTLLHALRACWRSLEEPIVRMVAR